MVDTNVNSIFFIQVTFEGVRGRSFRGDIAIDDINILQQGCPQKG